MRIAVVDLGSNATRLLIADVASGGSLAELERRSTVTRLGQDVERTGVLAGEAMARVHDVLARYREAIDGHGSPPAIGVLTSAGRDAANGAAFATEIAERHGIDTSVISGDQEAQLTYRGAVSGRPPSPATTLVIDVGGGSTELALGTGATLRTHTSTQVGVVRHGERHLHHDPPLAAELAALRADARATFSRHAAEPPEQGIAVGGTAVSCAAMLAGAEHGTPMHGAGMETAALEHLLARTATLSLAQRRALTGLHPDRAPTIVAGIAILLEAAATQGLDRLEASERDLLHGAALQHTGN